MTATDEKDPWGAFCECLCESVAAIGRDYMEVEQDQGPTVIRERVYCYELYHQLRRRLPRILRRRLRLHGELDKAQHPGVIEALGGRGNPDFVVHMPGTNTNFVVMEVKRGDARRDLIQRDLEKLAKLQRRLCYKHSVLLLFGRAIDRRRPFEKNGVVILHHRNPGERPVPYPPDE